MNMKSLLGLAVAAPCFAALLTAQDPPASQSPTAAPDPAEPSAAERALAEQLMRRHAERSATVHVLLADYVQRRTTELSAKPLLSRGEFLFVRDPAAVVFRAAAPRVSIVRLTASRYEVYRPQQQRLERFALDGPELAQSLFAAVGGDAARLFGEFELLACTKVAQPPSAGAPPAEGGLPAEPRRDLVALRMRPRKEAVRARLGELILTLEASDAVLAAVAYRDASGDLVEIELSHLRTDPQPAPSAELEVPPGTTVLEHGPAAKR